MKSFWRKEKWEKTGKNYVVYRMRLLCENILEENLFYFQTASKCAVLNLIYLV